MTTLPYITSEQIFRAITPAIAVEAIQRALRDGLDPAGDAPRGVVPVEHGHLLIMPSEGLGFVGTKIASVAPNNPTRSLPRIQASYLLMDAATLAPVALLDGSALTTRRTAAVSGAAVDALAPRHAARLLVFGSGPQAKAHIETIRALRPIEHVVVAARDPYKSEGLAAWVVEQGMQARISQAMAIGSALPEADIVVTATSADEPLFDGSLVRPGALVLAIGSHEPDVRELDGTLLGRSTVIVEEREAALREAGDVVQAVAEGSLDPDALIGLRELVRGEVTPAADRPIVFKSVGMAWEDLVIAVEAFQRPGDRARVASTGGIGRSGRRAYAADR